MEYAMNHSKRATILAASLLTVATAAIANLAQAQAELRVVDGNLWAASSMAEKRAYLIGVANVVAVNRAVQVQEGKVDPQSANNRIDAAFDSGTIDSAVSRIDAWYAANPSRKGVPVLGVVWTEMVKGR
jgi:hypothetical protein